MTDPPPADAAAAAANAAEEAGLSSILHLPSLSDPILSFLSLTELYQFRATSQPSRLAVTSHLSSLPAMVVLGGLSIDLDDDDEGASISPSVHAFHPSTLEWRTLPPLPTPRFASAVCALPDGRILVAGGVVELGADAAANPSVFVEGGRSMMCQPPREAGTADWRGRCSQRGRRTDAVEVFDPRTARWEAWPPLPQPRAGARACLDADGGRVLVVGGSTYFREAGAAGASRPGRAFSRDVEVFDLASQRWLDGGSVPPMRSARTEFALARVPGGGIFVCGGTNRYLWPNTAITAEFYDFKTGRWTVLDPPAPGRYDEPGVVSRTEELGADCALLGDGRRVVVYGGLRVEKPFSVPNGHGFESSSDESSDEFDDEEDVAGSGQARRSERDCWWHCDESDDEEDDYFGGGGYQERAKREFDVGVYDVEAGRWLSTEKEEDEGRAFDSMSRAETGCGVWRARHDAILVVGGNYEFYGEDGRYPSHGATEEVFLVDGPKGKRLRLPWAKCLRRGLMAPGIASMKGFHALVEKHGWQDLRRHAKVELHGMNTASYNGRRGKIVKDVGGGATGRWGVLLEGETRPISIRAQCLRVL